MITTDTRPITNNWTIHDPDGLMTSAAGINALLGHLKVSDITPELLPYLAAAATELSQSSGITVHLPAGDTHVGFLRLIAKLALLDPHATGPHTRRLGMQLGRIFG